MGAFNSLRLLMECEECGSASQREVQFRYGHVWQHSYVIGSAIVWGPAAIGDESAERVLVDGWVTECPKCAWDGRCVVVVWSGRILGVASSSVEPDLPQDGWVPDE